MTQTKYKTVINGKLNNSYLLTVLKVTLVHGRPFRFVYTQQGWMCYTRYDTITANLPQDLDIAFESAMKATLNTAHKQIDAQLKSNPALAKKLGNEADQWGLKVFAAFKQGIYTPFKWDASALMRTDCYSCHAYPVKDYSEHPFTSPVKLQKAVKVDKDVPAPSPLSFKQKKA